MNQIKINNRRTGQFFEMIKSIAPSIALGKRVGVAGCDNPDRVKEYLLKYYNLDVEYEKMTVTDNPKPKYDFEGQDIVIVGWTKGRKRKTGYSFMLKSFPLPTDYVDTTHIKVKRQ